MSSNADRAERWIDVALGRTGQNLAPRGTVYADGDRIYSYGRHFEMARIMRGKDGRATWVLLNGDRYSVTTSGHQSLVRGVVARSGLPSMIVPYSALDAAGIHDYASIRPIDIRPDRVDVHDHESAEMPGRWIDERRAYVGDRSWTVATLGDDGVWRWQTRTHWLGDSLFYAKARGQRRRFLSSFDYQEANPLYFLCELARVAKPDTVADAIECLKPENVRVAIEAGLDVSRQGDIFAIPTELTTAEVRKLTPHGKGRIVKRPAVLGTNHEPSEVMFATAGRVYARGCLYHAPEAWRGPDHARRKLGDGRTWHLLTRNTVPRNHNTARDRLARI